MGCVPSRCLYCYSNSNTRSHHHRRVGSGKIPLLRSVSTPLRRRRGRAPNHHHFVALTSTTYGLLRWNSSNNGPTSETVSAVSGSPVDSQMQTAAGETPFFDTTASSKHEECCFACTDKEVVGVVQSSPVPFPPCGAEECIDVSGAVSVSSSSSYVNKMVSLDQFPQYQQQKQEQQEQAEAEAIKSEPEVINIMELMHGLDEDCSRALLTPSSPSLRRTKSPLSRVQSTSGKRRTYHRSVSLSAIQAARKLDNVFADDGVSPAALERLLKEIYNYYVSGGCRRRLSTSLSSSPWPTTSKSQPRSSRRHKANKENTAPASAPKFDKTPGVFEKGLLPTMRRNRSNSNSPLRSRSEAFAFTFFSEERISGPATPPVVPKQHFHGTATPKAPFSPVAVGSNNNNPRSESPLFRTSVVRAKTSPAHKNKKPCCKCSCCGDTREELRSTSFSGPIFDPELLASIERAFQAVSAENWYSSREEDLTSDEFSSTNEETPLVFKNRNRKAKAKTTPAGTSPSASGLWDSFWAFKEGSTAKKISFSKVSPLLTQEDRLVPEQRNPLDEYEYRCPPGGESSVVLYCTSLRGIRKTFEDCHNLQMMLRSFGVFVDERDVSMHSDFRTELKQLLDNEPAAGAVPRLFIKGRYVGGLEEARKAHDDGKLVKMLEGIPKEDPFNICDGCGGLRFIPCLECSGSCKLLVVSEDKAASKMTRCPDCNENGLIRCPICC